MLLARQTREVNLLKTDPGYLETIARDRLDLMKEGETIFRLEQPPRNGSRLRAGALGAPLIIFRAWLRKFRKSTQKI